MGTGTFGLRVLNHAVLGHGRAHDHVKFNVLLLQALKHKHVIFKHVQVNNSDFLNFYLIDKYIFTQRDWVYKHRLGLLFFYSEGN